ncbi:MAG: radical SAM family heme chaperone HemW [Acidimicrobiales bacterium]
MQEAPFGIYVHVPFCEVRCHYCAFATWDDRPHLIADYVDAVVREIGAAADAGLPVATTVFFGGGTPSLLSAEQLTAIVAALPLDPGAEVSVECNPDTVDLDQLQGYRDCGVNRISLGVQSMVPHVLAALGRTHDPANVALAVEAIREVGFPTWNMDLIYGAVGESVVDWAATLDASLALQPPHVSAYGLTVEAGTPLAEDLARHPDDDDEADKYVVADAALGAAGLVGYEVSNWARPGHECRHNAIYWSQGDYRGFGCAAHSHESGRRWWNVRTPERYIALVDEGRPTIASDEVLDAEARRVEGLQLALRTRGGVPEGAVPDDEDLDRLVRREAGRATLTLEGRLLANEVAVRLR